jgi:MFS family permease
MRRRGHLATAFAAPEFRRLIAVRLVAQLGDGIFQASLAGAVLFNPEHQASAADVAAGFAVVLAPYSFVGPFAGVLLDRWRRQRTLVTVNLVRALCVFAVALEISAGLHGLPFYASALVVISLSRFVLSGLSAALPHVVRPGDLVTANAFATTAGAIVTTAGGGAAIAVRALIGDTDRDYAVIAVSAAAAYVIAGLVARSFDVDLLGPDDAERGRRETFAEVVRGLVAGARTVRAHPSVFAALTMITVHRLCYGVTTVCTILLYRNYFHSDGVFRAGLGGLGQVVAAVAIGGGVAALATPAGTRRFGFTYWPAALLVLASVTELAFGLPYSLPLLLVAALLLGFCAQAIKISVDTLVQRDIPDAYRGRVFAIYDTLFNVTLVAAAVITAVALPQDGHSPTSVILIAAGYLTAAVGYLRWQAAQFTSRAVRTTG